MGNCNWGKATATLWNAGKSTRSADAPGSQSGGELRAVATKPCCIWYLLVAGEYGGYQGDLTYMAEKTQSFHPGCVCADRLT